MSCLGQCGDCQCEKYDICAETEDRHKLLDKKLKVLKDYACLLGTTTCVNLPKRVGQYAYYVWCYLRDMTIMLKNNNKRLDNLCAVAKCQDAKLKAIMQYIQGNLQESVDFKMVDTGSTGAEGDTSTYTKIDTWSDGTFAIRWNMTELQQEVGKGVVNGKVNHTYTQNEDGSIKAKITGFTLKDAKYTLSGRRTANHVASFTVFDKDGKTVWKKDYDPDQAWSENINKTVPLNIEFDVAPKGGKSQNYLIMKTLDDWVNNDTNGTLSINYTNNHSGVVLPLEDCDIKCGACENKEEGE